MAPSVPTFVSVSTAKKRKWDEGGINILINSPLRVFQAKKRLISIRHVAIPCSKDTRWSLTGHSRACRGSFRLWCSRRRRYRRAGRRSTNTWGSRCARNGPRRGRGIAPGSFLRSRRRLSLRRRRRRRRHPLRSRRCRPCERPCEDWAAAASCPAAVASWRDHRAAVAAVASIALAACSSSRSLDSVPETLTNLFLRKERKSLLKWRGEKKSRFTPDQSRVVRSSRL